MNIYFDTSIFIAAAVILHPHHTHAKDLIQSLNKSKRNGFTSTHTLAEFYSVLTRAPFRPTIFPAEASQIIDLLFNDSIGLVSLTAREA